MNPGFAAARAAAALCAALLLALAGCGGDEPAGEAGPQGATAAGAAASRARGVEIRVAAGRVRLASEQVLQLAILEELAKQAGFELVVGSVTPRSLTLRLEDAPLLEAISTLLEGVPFRAEYKVDGTTGGHVLARLIVGDAPLAARGPRRAKLEEKVEAATGKSPDEVRSAISRKLAERRREEEPERVRAARAFAERARERQVAALEQLAAADAAQRSAALEDLDPDGEALAQIAEVAKSDPDASVRAAAVARLGDGDSYRAKTALLEALADPAPQVLVAALQALETAGDASMLTQIEPFAAHPDPSVREAATETIENLQ
jgi:hypothetical protein